MKKLFLILVLLAGMGYALDESEKKVAEEMFYRDIYGSPTGISQIYQLMNQLSKTLGDIPPDVRKLAIYQIRVDRREFTPGMARFIRGKIEETFIRDGRRKLASSPELKTMRIHATDSSFSMANTIPTLQELWEIGEKLRVDAFIEGSVTRSDDEDILLNLKVVQHKSAEILWTGTFVAGPNKPAENLGFEFVMAAGTGLWPVEKHTVPTATANLTQYQYFLEARLGEPTTDSKRILFTGILGTTIMHYVSETSLDSTPAFTTDIYLGSELLLIGFEKTNRDQGYWLGIYGGGKVYVLNQMTAAVFGLRSRFTKHLALNGGINYLPLNRSIVGKESSLSLQKYNVDLEVMTYEASIHYFF